MTSALPPDSLSLILSRQAGRFTRPSSRFFQGVYHKVFPSCAHSWFEAVRPAYPLFALSFAVPVWAEPLTSPWVFLTLLLICCFSTQVARSRLGPRFFPGTGNGCVTDFCPSVIWKCGPRWIPRCSLGASQRGPVRSRSVDFLPFPSVFEGEFWGKTPETFVPRNLHSLSPTP